MRILLLAAGAALALSACGGGEQTEANSADAMTTDANMMAADNMMMDQNMAMNGTMDANMTTDPATQNMMMEDMNTNAPDTNLANGM
jgi:hypothetical protein